MPHVIPNRDCEPRRRGVCCGRQHTHPERCQRRHACRGLSCGRCSGWRCSRRCCARRWGSGRRCLSRRCLSGRLCAPGRGRRRSRCRRSGRCCVWRSLLQRGAMRILPVSALLLSVRPADAHPAATEQAARHRTRSSVNRSRRDVARVPVHPELEHEVGRNAGAGAGFFAIGADVILAARPRHVAQARSAGLHDFRFEAE
jgi:hypothetical protein